MTEAGAREREDQRMTGADRDAVDEDVTDRREGRWVYYTLNRETLDEIETLVGSLKRTERTAARSIKCCD